MAEPLLVGGAGVSQDKNCFHFTLAFGRAGLLCVGDGRSHDPNVMSWN